LKFAQICPKQALKYTLFVNIQKRPKNGQMAKPFYFWQTVSKKAKWQPWFIASYFVMCMSIWTSAARFWGSVYKNTREGCKDLEMLNLIMVFWFTLEPIYNTAQTASRN